MAVIGTYGTVFVVTGTRLSGMLHIIICGGQQLSKNSLKVTFVTNSTHFSILGNLPNLIEDFSVVLGWTTHYCINNYKLPKT